MTAHETWYQSLQQGRYYIAKCYKCGHTPERGNLIDSLHPTGFGEDSLWSFTCLGIEGGCDDVSAYGRSEKEAVDRWNGQAGNPEQVDLIISRKLEAQLRTSIGVWAERSNDLTRKLQAQISITDSLKRDLAALQGRTVQPCPAAAKMGEHACTNQHECWEPCGVMGNDGRFARISVSSDAVDAALGIIRPNCQQTFHGAKIVSAPPTLIEVLSPSPEPLMLPLTQPSRRGKSLDNGSRRRRDD